MNAVDPTVETASARAPGPQFTSHMCAFPPSHARTSAPRPFIQASGPCAASLPRQACCLVLACEGEDAAKTWVNPKEGWLCQAV